MFDFLSEKLTGVLSSIRGKGTLSEKDVDAFLREIKLVFLEADIHFKVVKEFIGRVREKAVAEQVLKTVSPGEQVSKIVYDELLAMLGKEEAEQSQSKLSSSKKPFTIMMAGLQGTGKTTNCVKLANFLKSRKNTNCGIIAADLARPAAIDQLEILASKYGIEVYKNKVEKNPVKVCRDGRAHFADKDLIIIDTAGRIHLDVELMDELKNIYDSGQVDDVCLVIDAMTGQESLTIAEEFNRTIPLDGAIVTKMDGDAKGGCAVSFRSVTGKPIRYISNGEKIEDFEEFFPERIANRIFDMGDMMGMVEKAELAISENEAKALEKKLKKNSFDMNDVLTQIRTIRKMGGVTSMLSMLPGGKKLKKMMAERDTEKDPMKITEAVILSMTKKERANPQILNGSRRERIARGCGMQLSDVNDVIKQYNMMKKMMKTGVQKKLMKQLNALGGSQWLQ